MASPRENIAPCDPVWSLLREQAQAIAAREPAMTGFV